MAGAVPAGGFGSVASLKALGYKAFNEKLNIAGVGVGGRGAEDLRGCASENIVALCDVDSRQGGPTFKRYEKATQYTDFRKMLDKEDKNIDAWSLPRRTTCTPRWRWRAWSGKSTSTWRSP